MDAQPPPPAPCYECGQPTRGRLGRVWFIDEPRCEDDGQVLLPSTPLCDGGTPEAPSCETMLYSSTMSASSLAASITSRRSRWTPRGNF